VRAPLIVLLMLNNNSLQIVEAADVDSVGEVHACLVKWL